MFIATVEYIDGSTPDEMRGYQEAKYENGVAQFIWDAELVTIPLHRIKIVSEVYLEEGKL